jgi:hypothetical protein
MLQNTSPELQQTQPRQRRIQRPTLHDLTFGLLMWCVQFLFPDCCMTPRIMFLIPEVSLLFRVSKYMQNMLKDAMGVNKEFLLRLRKEARSTTLMRFPGPNSTSVWIDCQFDMFRILIDTLVEGHDLPFLRWVILEYNHLPYKRDNWGAQISIPCIYNLQILQWIVANLDTLQFHFLPEMCMEHAIKHGNLEIVEFLFSNNPTPSARWYFDDVIASGHLSIVQWLIAHEETMGKFTDEDVKLALQFGQMEIAKAIADTLTSDGIYFFYLNHESYPVDFVNWVKEKVLMDTDCNLFRNRDFWFGTIWKQLGRPGPSV